jgi:hypothetical protein
MALFLCASVSLVFADDANDESTTVEETTGNGTSSDENSSDDNTTTSTTEIPAVQGVVSLCKTDNTVLATATLGEDGTATFTVTGLASYHYFNIQYTVDDVTYFISALASRDVTSTGVGYQVKAGEQASGTSFHFANANTSDYFKIVLDTNAKTVSGGTISPIEVATSATLKSSSSYLSGKTATKENGKFVFLIDPAEQQGTKSFYITFTDGNNNTYNVVASDASANNPTATNAPVGTVTSSSTTTPNFTFDMMPYKMYQVTLDVESLEVSVSSASLSTDLELTTYSFPSGECRNWTSDGIYYYEVTVTEAANSGNYFYFSYEVNNTTYYILAETSNDRNLANGEKRFASYNNVNVNQAKFQKSFTVGKTYRITIDTNKQVVNAVVLPDITGDLKFVNLSNNQTSTVSKSDEGKYTFSSLSFSGAQSYYYFSYQDGSETYYVHVEKSASQSAANQVRRKDGEQSTTSVNTLYYVIDTDEPTLDNGLAFSTDLNGTSVIDFSTTNRSFTKTDTPFSSGVAAVEAEASDVAPVYYNLQGMRVDNPEHGIYIRCRGNKVDKVAL